VISFLNRANSFSRVCLFCIFVRNKIYVMEIEMPKPVVLARYLKIENLNSRLKKISVKTMIYWDIKN